MKNYTIFKFKKKEGKWDIYLNSETVFYFYQTFGFPPEMFIEEIKRWTPERFMSVALKDWIKFNKL